MRPFLHTDLLLALSLPGCSKPMDVPTIGPTASLPYPNLPVEEFIPMNELYYNDQPLADLLLPDCLDQQFLEIPTVRSNQPNLPEWTLFFEIQSVSPGSKH